MVALYMYVDGERGRGGGGGGGEGNIKRYRESFFVTHIHELREGGRSWGLCGWRGTLHLETYKYKGLLGRRENLEKNTDPRVLYFSP